MKKIQTGVQWSRYCLRSLFVTFLLVLTFGVTDAWGATSSVNTANLWKASTDDANDRVVWTAPNVTFKLHNNGDGGNIELYLNDHILIQKNKTYKLEWEVADGYTIEVQRVSVQARSTLKSYITVGSTTSGNIYGQSYTTVTSEALSLGNDGYVTICPNQGVDGRDDAIVHMDDITVTYTFSGLTYTVRFNANLAGASGSTSDQTFSFDQSKALTANGFSKSGYKFVGWTTNSDGSGMFYADKAIVCNLSSTNGATVNLYAKWTNEQTATFDGTADWRNNGVDKYAPDSFEVDASHVAFLLKKDMKQYNTGSGKKTHEYFYLSKDLSSILRWKVASGYTIEVNKIYFYSRNKTVSTGKGYVHTSRMNLYDRKLVHNSGSWGGNTFAVSDASNNLFGATPTALGNSEYFTLSATTNEWQITTITLTYSLAPNEYTITLNDNGGHGGDGTHKVTYDAATGSLTNAPTKYGYNFTGYYTATGDTLIFNSDKTPVQNVAKYTDNSASKLWKHASNVTLYAHWTAKNCTITLNNQGADTGKGGTASLAVTFDANTNLTSSITKPIKTNYTFEGYYTGENGTGTKIIDYDGSIIASAGDDTYTDSSKNWKYAGNITLYAKWTSKQTPRFTPDGFTSESTNAIYVGDVLSLTVANVSDGLAGDFIATYDDTYFNVTREGNTISIEALNAGDGKTVVFTQTENSSIFAATETYTFNVSKVANTMTIKDDCEKYVGQELTDVIGNINSNGTITTTSSAAGIAHYDIANDKIVVDNASAVQFGASQDVTIIINQAATYKYTAASETIVVTVKKYPNAITCSWGEWSKDVNFDSETGVTFSSNNDTGTPIVVTPSPASSVATYDGTNNKIVANFREGTATWTISQAEDYKYQAATTKTLTVNVGTNANSDCLVLNDATQREWSSQGNSGVYSFSIDEPGETLYFDAMRTDICVIWCLGNNTDWHIEYSTKLSPENGDWIDLPDGAIECEEKDKYYNNFAYPIPAAARSIRFITANIESYGNKFIKNVRVTRKKWFDIENADEEAITEIDMPSKTASGDATTATFYVDYSTCDDEIKVVSDHPHITVSDASFSSTTAARKAITLTYNSSEAEEIEATVTIYTRYEHKTLTVNAETKVLSTTLEYKGADSYAVDHANMNATDLFQVRDENGDLVASPTITLISNATGVINTVSSNTAIDFICGGSATITASFAGVANMYEAASDLGQTITVNKLSDAISWSGVGDDGKIHVWADTDIPTSIASSHTDIASYSVASANPYLSVTEEDGVYTLHAGIVGEVALTATSAGDCMYATASGSKTIAVDPREHAIIWDQDLEGIQTDDRGYIINRRITLNAYAVDNESDSTNVPVSYEITGGGTFATIENGNELVINVANLSGTLSTTITATTTVGTKYAIVSETKTISVVRWGTNTAKSADNTSDIKDGKIVISAPHATFTFSGETDITEFGYATVFGKPEGYKLAQSLDKNGGSKTYNFSWVSTNANCSIQVNKISFWIKAYDSDAFVSNKAKVSFDGAAEESVGTAAMTANDGDFAKFSKPENYTNRNVPVVCRVTGYENFDFYIKNISIEYTVYTTAPSATEDIEQVDRTINTSDKQTVDVRSLFSYATPAPSDFEYSYEIVGAPEHAFLEGGYMFWADAVGDYTVRAKVNMDEDHRESEWGSEKTIRVNKVPYVFNNSAEDQKWDTKNNWTISSWPIENLPTEDDDVIVRGHLTIDEEITINSMKIDAGEGYIVEIAPTGGLTVGAGGVIGATSDNLILKAGTSGATKGQTGYLRISPDYAGAMPEATVEMLCQGYSNAYTKNNFASGTMMWQYLGAPVKLEGTKIKSVVPGWINSWDEATGAWVNNRSSVTFVPFKGFANSQNFDAAGVLATYSGLLIDNDIHPVDLTHGESEMAGWNLLANSFAAPIDIKKMFEYNGAADVENTVYIFNASTGTYTPVTKANAGSTVADVDYQGVIPSMQGFFIKANSACTFKFDYTSMVWEADYTDGAENTPMRVNKRYSDEAEKQVVSVTMEANGQTDKVLLIESEEYDIAFENGYDAHYMPVGGFNIFAVEEEDHLAIDATNSIIGTRLGVRTGEETAYTMTFNYVDSENNLLLWDIEADEKIAIREGGMYTFFIEPNSMNTGRFVIIEAEAPTVTTGVDNASESGAKVHKFIKDNQLYILKNGVLYNGTGARVK